MKRTRRWVATVAPLAVMLAACGGGGGGDDDPAGSAADGDSNGGSGISEVETPDIDPGSMPPAGEAQLEVDGQTFVFRQADMLEGPFTCEVADDAIRINFQSDRHDLLLQGAVTPEGEIIASATVVPEESDSRYASSGAGGQGAVATDGSFVVYTGRFDQTPKDDPASFTDVGMGTISVTCP